MPLRRPQLAPPAAAASPADTTMRQGSEHLRLSKLLVAYAAAGLAICFAIYRAYITSQPVYPPGSLIEGARGGGAGSCRMSYMSPSYLHLSGFGREFTRMGNGPWGLYLYREAGWDQDPYVDDGQGGHKLLLTGTPILFVPGNAGSFRQVRSLASAASRSWYEAPGVKRRGSRPSEGAAPLDFFTIDFNDDFSAFHGQTLLDQAEYTADCIRYILSLYAHHEDEASGRKRPDPVSVMVVGHSMGGVVARAAVLSPNYQPYSISTLVTLATPHVVPPVTVDAGVDRVYAAVNSYWRQAYDLADPYFVSATKAVPVSSSIAKFRALPHEELRDLVLVSIAGGISDVTIASESVSLASLVPADGSNGFTIFTTAIPGVQTPIDHLAILWCQQLMQVVAEGLLAIVDVRRPQGVAMRSERVRELSTRWIGGLGLPPAARHPGDSPRLVPLDELESHVIKLVHLDSSDRLVHQPKETARGRAAYRLPIPTSRIGDGPRVFALLSSATIGRKAADNVEVWICKNALGSEDEPASGACSMVHAQHTTLLPSSPHSSVTPILPAPVEEGAISSVRLEAGDFDDKSALVVIVKDCTTDWVLAEFSDAAQQTHKIEHGALRSSIPFTHKDSKLGC
jgi:glycosylphosphatidylinositol deacylase